MRKSISISIIGLVLVAVPLKHFAQSTGVTLPNGSLWSAPSRVTVTSRSPEIPDVEQVTIQFGKDGNSLISETYPEERGRVDHQLFVVGGRWVAMKNVAVKPGSEIDALDGPMLTVQLVLRFLEKAYPSGPAAVKGKQPIEVSEKFKPIRVNTVSAEGGWEAPWSLRGTLERRSPSQVDYDFLVLHSEPGDPNIHSIRFSGTWENGGLVEFPSSMPLRDWRVYKLGPISKTTNTGATVDFAAEPEAVSYATLSDLLGKPATPSRRAESPARKLDIPASLSSPMQRY